MKQITAILVTALLAFAIGLFTQLPWFSFVFTSFLVAVALPLKPGKAFISGFLSVFLLWAALAYIRDAPNEHILSTKVASILPLGGSWIAVLMLTAMLGGLLSGLAALTGAYLRHRPAN